ncbi:TetR/AcrR family transcriptional regulator [Kiloniella sp. EL199]|uniref:TetR/AcrR family transcriptional regulator n=1 Tax=Kiloniella sp. EL199 TaxID=2107581 RepID=UPI0013C439BC|nr:TetR family transcriptional regulator [Kiloniella sp. EL199]
MKKSEIPQHIVSTAMSLAVEKGWATLSLAEIAVASKVSLSDLHQIFPSRNSILRFISEQADQGVLEEHDNDYLEQPAKDRLFDICMNRFDALIPYKEGIRAIAKDSRRDPISTLLFLCNLKRSMPLMLETTGLSTSGLRGILRVKAFSVAYLVALQTWLNDNTEDLGKTMVKLDKVLGRLDTVARRCSGMNRVSRSKAA